MDAGRLKGLRDLEPRYQRLLALLVFAPTIALAIRFLRVPVDEPVSVSALLIDRTLQVGVILLLPAALLTILFAPWPLPSFGAIGGGAVAVALGLSALSSGLRPPVLILPMALAALSIICGGAFLAFLLHERIRSVRLGAALVAPLAILPALQFWHASSFTPSRLTPSLTITPVVASRGLVGDESRADVTVTIENVGDAPALLLSSTLFVCHRRTRAEFKYDRQDLREDEACVNPGFFAARTTVTGNTTHATTNSISVPQGHDLLQVAVWVDYARADRVRTSDVREYEELPTCEGRAVRRKLQPEAKFRGVVVADRWLTYDEHRNGYNYYLTVGDEAPCEQSAYPTTRYVGLDQWRVFDEAWLGPAATSDAEE